MAEESVEMRRYGASELMRNKNLQKKFVNYGIDKMTPIIQKTIRNTLDQLLTKVRPDIKYKTDRKDLDGRRMDIHNAIGKLPKPKKGWTFPGHFYTGPFNNLLNQVKCNPETGEILEIYKQPTGKTDAVGMQHDVDYIVCSNKPKSEQVKCKNEGLHYIYLQDIVHNIVNITKSTKKKAFSCILVLSSFFQRQTGIEYPVSWSVS